MSGTVWTKFYWSDWETDHALKLCSLSAQGLWMRMLCIASAHDPIGYVAVAGRGLDETALARMTGCSESEVSALLGELDRNGVFSRDRQGRIYSRRMVADAKKAAIARKNGKNGGNPSLGKYEKNRSSVNPPLKPPLKPQEPDARNQIEPVPDGTGPVAPPEDHDKRAWDEAVALLSKAGSTERTARSFFGKLISENRLMARDLLPSLAAATINGTGDPQSYLRQAAAAVGRRRHGDAVRKAPDPTQWGSEERAAAEAIWRETGRWSPSLGPPPDDPAYRRQRAA